MQCEEVRDQFTDYLAGSLADPGRSDVQQHLITCESCRNEAEDLKTIWLKLDAIPAEKPDSAAMRARFDVMLEAYRQGMDHAPSVSWWSRLNRFVGAWWPQQPVLQFGLAMALLTVGLVAGRQYAPVAAPPQTAPAGVEVTQLRDEVHSMRQMVAVALMQQQSATDRLKGVSWSNQIERPDTEMLNALIDTLMHDENVNVRLAAVDALKKYGDRQMVKKGVLQALEKQDSPFVQVALIDYMVDMQEKDSVGTLRKLSQDTETNENVRKHAEWGLENLR
jgi:anti-sigma factor RsiW